MAHEKHPSAPNLMTRKTDPASCESRSMTHSSKLLSRTFCLIPFPLFSLFWFPLCYSRSPTAPVSWSNTEMSGWAEYKGCQGRRGREWRKSSLQLTLSPSSPQSMSSVKYKQKLYSFIIHLSYLAGAYQYALVCRTERLTLSLCICFFL